MKMRQTTAALFASLFLLAAAGAAFAMDANELINKSLDAQGGLAAMQAVKSQKATGKFLTQGMEIPYTMVQARPNRLRIDAAVMGMSIIQCFDGTTGWSVNPMTGSTDAQPMGELEIKSFRLQADMDGPLVGWADKGFVAEYMGQEDVEGTPAYRLRLDTKQDVVMDYWFDADSFLVLKQNTKMKIDQGEFETQNYPSDYRQQDGLTIPFSIETRRGDQVLNTIVIDTLEPGVAVDDAVFVMPAKTASAAVDTTGN